MIINFQPRRADIGEYLAGAGIEQTPEAMEFSISVAGDVITVAGEEFDFSFLNAGDTLPASAVTPALFAGAITRGASGIEITVILPHGPSQYAPHERCFPQQIVVTEDGVIALPDYGYAPVIEQPVVEEPVVEEPEA